VVRIREAKKSDAEEIRSVAEKTWYATYDGFISHETIETVIEKWYKVTDLKQQVEDPYFFVAVVEGDVAGFVHATISKEDKEVLELHRIYLDPDYWGQGVGSKLLQKVLESVDKGIDRIALEVLQGNEVGRGFYVSKDFEEVERESVELFGEPVTQIVMEKKL